MHDEKDDTINDRDAIECADSAAFMLEAAVNNLRRINADINAVGSSFAVNEAIEYTKVTALIGIGHALTAIAQALTEDEDGPDVADMLTNNIITEQFNN
ncbi:hypothetical protein [Bifidobacterium castoris]|uniref:Uncharacterized protein n=1 Tax=Bifidobacterium castoris TaxID=2306972 RepID=A0A430F4G2_9BIFI|nr:hypothetical protein [Bifidobacterium castoris]RSX44679.1 hypothetical protein D2E22_1965 [Bifidobacterium castoris]